MRAASTLSQSLAVFWDMQGWKDIRPLIPIEVHYDGLRIEFFTYKIIALVMYLSLLE